MQASISAIPASRYGIFVSVGKGIHSVFGYPALGVEGGQRDLVQVLPVDVVLL